MKAPPPPRGACPLECGGRAPHQDGPAQQGGDEQSRQDQDERGRGRAADVATQGGPPSIGTMHTATATGSIRLRLRTVRKAIAPSAISSPTARISPVADRVTSDP